jgi:hypothetical protein
MRWQSPFALPGNWYRGNLHTHTTQSDGRRSPEDAIAWYREQGYDFLALSDHWVLTPGRAVSQGFITLTATELNGEGYHLLVAGLAELPPRALEHRPQAVIDHVKAQGALAYIAHPYWTGRPSGEIAALRGLDGMEVYNSVCEISKGTGHARVHWDDCLSTGRRLTGLAVDDTHWGLGEAGGGYIMVRAQELTEQALLAALHGGHFYASAGPVIQDLRVQIGEAGEPVLDLVCSPCAEIVFYTCGPRGRRIAAEPGASLTRGSLPLQREQVFVRVECRDAQGRCAWTNPVYLEDVLGE